MMQAISTSERLTNSRECTTWRKETIWNLPIFAAGGAYVPTQEKKKKKSLLKANLESITLQTSFQFES